MPRPRWTPLPTLALATVSLTLVAGCGLLPGKGDENPSEGAGEEKAQESDTPPDSIDTRPTNSWELPGGKAEVSLHRVDDHMVAYLVVTNEAGNDLHLSSHLADGFGESGNTDNDYPWNYFSGIAWLDPEGRILHKPYHLKDRSCLCSSTGSDAYLSSEGDTWEGYAVLAAPPEHVEELTLISHIALPFVDVPIQGGPPEGVDYTTPQDEPEAEPEQAELESVIESDQETVIEDKETTDINLSTDVLFELEESELTDEADELIADAAQQIEDMGATEVMVEGHADSSGDDEINDPLSEARAESVRDALEELIDSDIDFETKGYGSDEPIASNSDEDGRARNRRVTISVPRGTPTESTDTEETGDTENGEDAEPAQGEGTPATEASLTGPSGDAFDSEAEVEVALTDLRTLTPSTVLLSYKATNPNDKKTRIGLDMVSERWMEFRYHATHAVTLDDPDGGRSAHPLRVESLDTDGRAADKPYCLCSSTSGINMGSTQLGPEETREYYALLPIIPGSTVTDVTIGEVGTMENVAIAH